jgi:hypothetical protein
MTESFEMWEGEDAEPFYSILDQEGAEVDL